MPTVEELHDEIESVDTIRIISSALLEISALRIRDLRSQFEYNDQFFSEISELYNIVKLSAFRQHYTLPREKAVDSKKIAAVAVTSNKGFHGLLNTRVVESFLGAVDLNIAHGIVIGNTGKNYLEHTDHYAECEYLTFLDDYPTPGETQTFLNRISGYDKVFLYYPKFLTVFAQDIGVIDITYSAREEVPTEKQVKHIFEPELPKIVEFFETQVRRLLFMRIMLESELARLSARLVKMSTTEDRANSIINQKERELRKQVLLLNDVQLLESFSSIKEWKK